MTACMHTDYPCKYTHCCCCCNNRLAADGLDMLRDLVEEGSHAAKSSWQDTAEAAGRLYDQLDQTLAVSTTLTHWLTAAYQKHCNSLATMQPRTTQPPQACAKAPCTGQGVGIQSRDEPACRLGSPIQPQVAGWCNYDEAAAATCSPAYLKTALALLMLIL
jgi:hypothetical protein